MKRFVILTANDELKCKTVIHVNNIAAIEDVSDDPNNKVGAATLIRLADGANDWGTEPYDEVLKQAKENGWHGIELTEHESKRRVSVNLPNVSMSIDCKEDNKIVCSRLMFRYFSGNAGPIGHMLSTHLDVTEHLDEVTRRWVALADSVEEK